MFGGLLVKSCSKKVQNSFCQNDPGCYTLHSVRPRRAMRARSCDYTLSEWGADPERDVLSLCNAMRCGLAATQNSSSSTIFSGATGLTLDYDVDMYKMTYNTVNTDSLPVIATGAFFIPKNTSCNDFPCLNAEMTRIVLVCLASTQTCNKLRLFWA